MSNPRRILIGVGAGALALLVAGSIALSFYSESASAKNSLVIKYFRALSAGDEVALDELTSSSFESDLGLGSLERDSYELFDFGEPAPGVIRFLIVLDEPGGTRRAVIADMTHKKHGFAQRVEGIRRVEEGTGIGK